MIIEQNKSKVENGKLKTTILLVEKRFKKTMSFRSKIFLLETVFMIQQKIYFKAP